ncbi:MAG TPA: helical backbone metal receptor [Mariprofundaceae bacterium]|nr:helical backbone metal receptor [Mariprofundaceae bacterium]
MADAGAASAERILALSPHVCEILFAIGAGDDVVGGSEYCDYPAAAKALPRVATFNQVYVEAALQQRPTLAIVLNPAMKGLEALRQAGVRIETSNPKSIAAVLDDIRRLGKASGHEVEAGALAEKLALRLRSLQQGRHGKRIRVFYEIWHQPLMAVGGTGFLHDMLRQAGLDNVFDDVPLEGTRVTVESVIRVHPELIIVAGKDVNLVDRRSYWQQWLPDVRVMAADENTMHRPGPRIVDALETFMHHIRALPAEQQREK